VLYEVIAYVVPGLTKAERTFLAPVVFGSSILFYFGWGRRVDRWLRGLTIDRGWFDWKRL
jgi:hypothetical protein